MAEKENKNNKTDDGNVAIPKEEYEKLKACAGEAADLQDKFLRAHAEFENAKKRLEKDKIDYLRFANDSFLLEFLPILDSLEIAEKHIKEAKDFKAVQEGVDMIQLQIQKFLKDIGVEKVKAAGEKFDPHAHEAVETEDAKDKEDGLILAELKPGYRVSGRLLRPACVRIVKHKD
ncbi:MAG: nucleotide exchange factor GrpE [Candidatus Omnitrophota bacterium]